MFSKAVCNNNNPSPVNIASPRFANKYLSETEPVNMTTYLEPKKKIRKKEITDFMYVAVRFYYRYSS